MVGKHLQQRILLTTLGIVLMTMIIINQLASLYPVRIDLTADKRFTLNENTRKLLGELEEPLYVEVYLAGDMPAGFKRLQNAIEGMLKIFEYESGGMLSYRFIDPQEDIPEQARNNFYRNLVQLGIQPTNIFSNESGQRSEQLIFPGALINYGKAESAVMLLRGNKGDSPETQLNQSIEDIEYQLAKTIQSLVIPERPVLGLLKGHGELDSVDVAALKNTLREQYRFRDVYLDDMAVASDISALLVLKPDQAFTDVEKFKLDQYLLRGGRILIALDLFSIDMAAADGEGTVTVPRDVNLMDLLFRYGVRINNDLIQELNAGVFPVVTGNVGNQPQVQLLPWPFFPYANRFGDHPVVRNLNAVAFRFASTLDTVKAEGIKKYPLVQTSTYSRALGAPVRIAFNDIRNIDPSSFSGGPFTLAYLLEGRFSSLFKNRLLPLGVSEQDYVEDATTEGKIIVIGDGDVFRTEFDDRDGSALPLGLDPYSGQYYGNADLLLNAIAYLTDDEGIIQSRSKRITIRPLDKIKVEQQRTRWQSVNIVLPILLIIGFGWLRYFLRKRNYEQRS